MQDAFKKQPGQPLRYFTYGDVPFNYGFVPCTWENPDHVDADTKCRGDGDPIDVVQLAAAPSQPGDYHAVRVLGVLGLVDEGETDWKILAEPVTADSGFMTIDRVPTAVKETVVDWFRNYKTTDGKKQNEFAFSGEIRGADDAIRIIQECAAQYQQLVSGRAGAHRYWLR
ncbi:inorganic pyrophosphatase [Strigomonas culicis]|nr:inorganic pyrophosphatase [Strigomonas culicis]|eukprot:EPY34444.1 inorganic pyrophosphatase [Strigomonas culicis]